jgi:HK97 family phage prohead protease
LNKKKNPVLLVNHDYKVENIVGAAKNIRNEENKLVFDSVFHEITQLSRDVKEMVKGGFLNTVSVGFMRKGPKKDGDMDKNELFEISFVPVPANPSAARLKAALEAGVNQEEKSKIEEWAENQLFTEEKEIVEEVKEQVVDHDVKEGRVLSGKNRKLIDEAVGVLKNAAGALEELLSATELPPKSIDTMPIQGRDPKVVRVRDEKSSVVVRALQMISKASNEALRETKIKSK